MRIQFQWPAAVVFSVACLTLGALVFTGHLHAEVLLGLVMWLIPGPWQPKAAPLPPVSSEETH